MNAQTIAASTPSSAPNTPLRDALRRAGRTAARRLFLDRQADFWLDEVSPLASRGEMRARVLRVIDETHDTKTFMLAPNRHWTAHRAGQFTTVEVEIDGVRVRRCYSISSGPADPHVSITVKRVPGGRVSGWLHDHVQRGDVIRLSPPAGEFVLPEHGDSGAIDASGHAPRLLFIAAGSGVTPFLSMGRDLSTTGRLDDSADIVMVYYARSAADVIGHDIVRTLAETHPGWSLHLILDDAPDARGGFSGEHLRQLVPDLDERATFLCGPAGLMERVEAFWAEDAVGAPLTRENFALPAVPRVDPGEVADVEVTLSRAGRAVVANSGETLLEQLERAGERPANGCRMGICQTCRCLKKSGTVRNLMTGAVSSEPDEYIQICVSAASSDIELDL